MNKQELIKAIAELANEPQSKVDIILGALSNVIKGQVALKGEINLGFVKIKTVERAEKKCKTPKSNGTVIIPAHTAVKVTACKSLKDAARGEK